MTSENNSSDKNASQLSDETTPPRLVSFWIVLPVYVPSFICCLFVVYCFIFNRTIRQALHNHVIIVLMFINVIIQFTNIPWVLNYYRLAYVWPQSPYFCMIWIAINEGSHIAMTLFVAWATVERHILIFHATLVSTKKKIIIFHYTPMLILFLYYICYSIVVIIFPSCENTFDYTQLICGSPLCYYDSLLVTIWDLTVDDITPTIIIIISSIALLLRILYQKNRMHQPIRWRKYRKMTIQLLAISALYVVIYIPHIVVELVQFCGVPEVGGAGFLLYAEVSLYYNHLLLPFVCVGSMPELQTQLKKIFSCCRRQTRVVHPQPMTLPRHPDHRQT